MNVFVSSTLSLAITKLGFPLLSSVDLGPCLRTILSLDLDSDQRISDSVINGGDYKKKIPAQTQFSKNKLKSLSLL